MIKLKDLPPKIDKYIGSYFATLKNMKLANRYRLPDNKLVELSGILGRVFLKEIALVDLPKILKNNLKMDEGTAFLLAADVAEQHFLAHQEYLGPIKALHDQWRKWGHELDGRQPEVKGSPEVEKLISQATKTPGPKGKRLDLRNKPKKPQVPERPQPLPKPVIKRTVGMAIKERQQKQQSSDLSQQARQQAARSPKEQDMRKRFLDQIGKLAIDNVRSDGESGHGRLQQMSQRIAKVIRDNPNDKVDIKQALHSSLLYQLYQEQGHEAIRSGQPMENVIYKRYEDNKPYLLKEEFDSVAQLAKEVQ